MSCLKKSAALLLKTSIHNIPGMPQSNNRIRRSWSAGWIVFL